MVERIVSNYLKSNVFIVKSDQTCLIIDTGCELEKVKQTVGNLKVAGVLLTHGHYDHSTYALDYAVAFNCQIFASEYIKEYLQNPEYNYSENNFKVEDFSHFKFLHGDGKLLLEDFEVEYFQKAGHSKADMIFKINNEIFVGDLLIGRDMGKIDLYGGSKKEMKNSLQFLQNLDYEIMHSGHGEDSLKINQNRVLNLWIKFLER